MGTGENPWATRKRNTTPSWTSCKEDTRYTKGDNIVSLSSSCQDDAPVVSKTTTIYTPSKGRSCRKTKGNGLPFDFGYCDSDYARNFRQVSCNLNGCTSYVRNCYEDMTSFNPSNFLMYTNGGANSMTFCIPKGSFVMSNAITSYDDDHDNDDYSPSFDAVGSGSLEVDFGAEDITNQVMRYIDTTSCNISDPVMREHHTKHALGVLPYCSLTNVSLDIEVNEASDKSALVFDICSGSSSQRVVHDRFKRPCYGNGIGFVNAAAMLPVYSNSSNTLRSLCSKTSIKYDMFDGRKTLFLDTQQYMHDMHIKSGSLVYDNKAYKVHSSYDPIVGHSKFKKRNMSKGDHYHIDRSAYDAIRSNPIVYPCSDHFNPLNGFCVRLEMLDKNASFNEDMIATISGKFTITWPDSLRMCDVDNNCQLMTL